MPTNVTRRPISSKIPPFELLSRHCADILASEGMDIERRCIQHGTTSVAEHSLSVTLAGCTLAQRLRIPVNERALLRGMLLHDYFLYDWHVPDPSHRFHGFRHPGFARANAVRDFGVDRLEQNMIARHMFPLTPIPPSSREGWILCVVDKYVATRETIGGFVHRHLLRRASIASRGGERTHA